MENTARRICRIPVSLKAHHARSGALGDKRQNPQGSLTEFDDPFVVEFQQNGKWIADQSSTTSISAAPFVPPPLFGGDDFFTRLGKIPATTSVTQIQPRQVPSPAPSPGSSAKIQDSQVAPFKSFGFSKNRAPQDPGTLDLGNMYAFSIVPLPDLTWCKGETLVL